MKVPFLNLKRQYDMYKDELEQTVIGVMRSGSYIGGQSVVDFEKEMAEYLGIKHVISCSNGTDALAIALKACGVNYGDEVITTPFTFFATAEAIASIGAVPVFVDISEKDLNIDVSKIEACITNKTKVILPVHIFGMPADMDEINDIARKHNLKVIEDAAQAIGSKYKDVKIGNTADIGCFSFYPTKNLGAFGDAGMITTNDDRLKTIITAYKEHGMGENGAKAKEYLYGVKNELEETKEGDGLYNPYKYFNYIIGYNSRLDSIQAAILRIKLKYLDTFNDKRAGIAKKYTDGLSQIIKTPVYDENKVCCYHQYAVRTDKRQEFCDYLASKGIGTSNFYPVPLHLQNAFDYLGYNPGSLPISEKVSGQTVCLPIFPELTDEEINYIIGCIKDFVEESNE